MDREQDSDAAHRQAPKRSPSPATRSLDTPPDPTVAVEDSTVTFNLATFATRTTPAATPRPPQEPTNSPNRWVMIPLDLPRSTPKPRDEIPTGDAPRAEEQTAAAPTEPMTNHRSSSPDNHPPQVPRALGHSARCPIAYFEDGDISGPEIPEFPAKAEGNALVVRRGVALLHPTDPTSPDAGTAPPLQEPPPDVAEAPPGAKEPPPVLSYATVVKKGSFLDCSTTPAPPVSAQHPNAAGRITIAFPISTTLFCRLCATPGWSGPARQWDLVEHIAQTHDIQNARWQCSKCRRKTSDFHKASAHYLACMPTDRPSKHHNIPPLLKMPTTPPPSGSPPPRPQRERRMARRKALTDRGLDPSDASWSSSDSPPAPPRKTPARHTARHPPVQALRSPNVRRDPPQPAGALPNSPDRASPADFPDNRVFIREDALVILPFPLRWPLICPRAECTFTLRANSYKRDAIRHLQRHELQTTIADFRFRCTVCDATFRGIKAAQTHYNDHLGTPRRPPLVQCRKCRKPLRSISEWTFHQALAHRDPARAIPEHLKILCPFCSSEWPNRGSALHHQAHCARKPAPLTANVQKKVTAVRHRARVFHRSPPADTAPQHPQAAPASAHRPAPSPVSTTRPIVVNRPLPGTGDTPHRARNALTTNPAPRPPLAPPPARARPPASHATTQPAPPPEGPCQVCGVTITDPVARGVHAIRHRAEEPTNIAIPLDADTDISAWFLHHFPPHIPRGKRRSRRAPVHDQKSLQALFRKSPKRAVEIALGAKTVECEVPPASITAALTEQLGTPPPFDDQSPRCALWQRSENDPTTLEAPFLPREVRRALRHSDSAPGTNGLRYSDLRKADPTGAKLCQLYNWCLSHHRIPDAWKEYETLLLFKKPREHQPGDEKVFKKFRPIALLDTAYKVLTSILASRLSSFYLRSSSLSLDQRALFGQDGVALNNFFLRRAVEKKNTIVFLDLADAFNSPPPAAIDAALLHTGVPPQLRGLIASLYRETSTTPVRNGRVHCGQQTAVRRGVRQGCPLSSLLFCLVLQPVIQTAEDSLHPAGGRVLGYMDDIALLTPDPALLAAVTTDCNRVASWLGLRFNAAKCGALRPTTPLKLGESDIPTIAAGQVYKYLGMSVGPLGRDTPSSTLTDVARETEALLPTDLSPQQKLQTIRQAFIPRATFALRHHKWAAKDTNRLDQALRKATKSLCALPTNTCNAYLSTSRKEGGVGVPNLNLWTAISRMTDALHFLVHPVTASTAAEDLLEIGRAKFPTLPPQEAAQAFLNGDPFRTTTSAGTFWWGEVRTAVTRFRRLTQLVPTFTHADGLWSIKIGETLYNGPRARAALQRVVDARTKNEWMSMKSQGRFADAITTSQWTASAPFSQHTRFTDWRFIHRARTSQLPVNAHPGNKHPDKRCRRCGAPAETQAHVFSVCRAHTAEYLSRHKAVLDLFIPRLARGLQTTREEAFGDGSLRPDLVVRDPQRRKAVIIDAKVSVDFRSRFNANLYETQRKYEPVRRALEEEGLAAYVTTLQLGVFGSLPAESRTALNLVPKSRRKATARMLAYETVHASRNLFTHHVTGVPQLT